MRDALGRRSIEKALRDQAMLEWCETFADLREQLRHKIGRVDVAVVDRTDTAGAAADALARELSARHPGIGIVVYMMGAASEADLCALGAAGVHDVVLSGRIDEGHALRRVLLGARRRGASDRVMVEVKQIVPSRLLDFVAAVLSTPEVSHLAEITARMGLHRQTPNTWCRRAMLMSAEELFCWCRMLLVSSLLETTSRTVESIALEFDYASATALRNQLKRYTGMTATEIREAGLIRVIDVFRGRIEQCRAGLGGSAQAAVQAVARG